MNRSGPYLCDEPDRFVAAADMSHISRLREEVAEICERRLPWSSSASVWWRGG
jgi:hypothetical protein